MTVTALSGLFSNSNTETSGAMADLKACLDTKGNYASTLPSGASLAGRSGNRQDGAAGYLSVNTILSPNGPTCSIGADDSAVLSPPTSFHSGGVNSEFNVLLQEVTDCLSIRWLRVRVPSSSFFKCLLRQEVKPPKTFLRLPRNGIS